MNCLKSLRKNLQWLQEPLYVYLHRFMRKGKLLPFIPGCGLYFPPQRAPEIPMGGRSKRRQFPRGWGQILKVFFFFQELWNKNYCFYWWFYINSYSSECLFHRLPVCYSLHVYKCHQLMNNAGHPAHCFIFHNIIVVFTVLWSCPISLLLTCF